MIKNQTIFAIAKYIRISPNKVRRVLNQIRGCSYQQALMILEFMPYRSCSPILKVLQSAGSNAENRLNIKKKDLIIKIAYVNEGPKLKRIKTRAKGQSNQILKPSCHITIIVESNLSTF